MVLAALGSNGVVSMRIASCYLFGKEYVVRYYKELERRADTTAVVTDD